MQGRRRLFSRILYKETSVFVCDLYQPVYIKPTRMRLRTAMGQVLTSIQTAWLGVLIAERHQHNGPRRGLQHRLEDAMVNTLSKPTPTVYVHWGAYESGKSRAASNAAIRLQAEGKFVMLIHGYDFTFKKDLRSWLRVGIGIPEEHANDKISTFFPADKQTVLIIDHPDYLLKQYGEKDLVDTLDALGIPVLILVGSWERAVDLKKQGCLLLGPTLLGFWTEHELDELYETFPERIRRKAEANKPELYQCAVLSGSPGILHFESHAEVKPNMHRARLIAAEWENGIRALNGEDMKGVTGRFPDKNHTFHWDAV